MAFQVALPETVRRASADEVQERIREAKRALGPRLVILGHHYQKDEVIRHADFTGDSFKLAQAAAGRPEADYIVFCGVHFMVEAAWEDVTAVIGEEILPVTYMNSTADLKAFVGQHGGAVCTSSNARAVMEWAFRQKPRVLFFPDQHLGRNTGYRMDIPLEAMPVWDPYEDRGGLTDGQIEGARVLLWKGHCSVHNRFTPDMVDRRRVEIPGVRVIVHPECRFEVVQKADAIGSTEGILKTVRESPEGTKWAVGTELNMVSRLAREVAPGRQVVSLDDCFCLCSTMARIDPPHLLWVLEGLREGEVRNPVRVPEPIAREARTALDLMLAIR